LKSFLLGPFNRLYCELRTTQGQSQELGSIIARILDLYRDLIQMSMLDSHALLLLE